MAETSATTILDGLTEGVLGFDSSATCRYANTAAQLLLRAGPELVGRTVEQVLDDGALAETCRRVATSRRAEAADHEGADGRRLHARVVPSEGGVVALLHDPGEPPPTCPHRDSPGLLQQVVDFAPVGITLTGTDGRLQLINRYACTWAGSTPDELLGRRLPEIFSSEYADRVARAQDRVLDSRYPEMVTGWVDRPDGQRARLETALFAVYDGAGELTGTGAIYSDVTAHEKAEQALQDASEDRRRLLDRLVDAQEHERARIAADIHDDSIQALVAVGLRLSALRRLELGDAAPVVAAVHDSLGKAMSRLRSLLFDLEPPGTDESLADGIRAAAEFTLDPSGIAWTFGGDIPDLPHAERVTAVRIAREALANVRTHARATSVTVDARRYGDGVEVTITDDGVGVGDVRSQPGHRGVTTMQDRATLAGGWLRIQAGAPRGTVVRYWLPARP